MRAWILLLTFCVAFISGEECECEEGVELEISCGGEFMLPTAISSRGQFFRDPVAATCMRIPEGMISEEEEIYTFPVADDGMSAIALCPHKHHVIHKLKFCMEDEHITAVTLHCRTLENPDGIIGAHEATSDEMNHSHVRCKEDSVMQSIDMTDSGDGVVTRVALECIELKMDNEEPPEPL